MKFSLDTIGSIYDEKMAKRLEPLGFTFKPRTGRDYCPEDFDKQDSNIIIEMNTLEELVAFSKKWGNLIFDAYGENPRIQIYDDYAE